jgi:hypothetical protein
MTRRGQASTIGAGRRLNRKYAGDGDHDEYRYPCQSRKVRLNRADSKPILSTARPTEIVGTNPNVAREPGNAQGSQINLTRQGVAVFHHRQSNVWLELCLVHTQKRLLNFYNRRAFQPGRG